MRELVLKLYAKVMKARAERDFEAAMRARIQDDRDMWRGRAIAAEQPVAQQRNKVTVPREPTKAMIDAGLKKAATNPHPWCPAVYRAMIAAAPTLSPERKDQPNG